MNSQQHIRNLRVQLLAMSRVSQRALDYAVKGYELRNLDFARQVPAVNSELEGHHRASGRKMLGLQEAVDIPHQCAWV